MDEKGEKLRAKRIAKWMALLMVFTSIGVNAYFVTSGKFSLKTVLISGPISLLIGMLFPALIYFWRGTIR